MPARHMMFEEMPEKYIGMKARRTEMGMVMMGTMAEGMCQRKRRMTRLTMTICRMSSSVRVSIDRWIRSERS